MSALPTIPRYAEIDYKSLWAEFPPAPEFLQSTFVASLDEIRHVQETRFLVQMRRAWEVPFYRKLWGNHGLQPGDIRALDDLPHLPTFSVYDLRESSEGNPPWGDLVGIDPSSHAPIPLLLQTSGGTTGMPRAMLYTPRDREVMNIMTGRRMYMQGVRPFDLVQVALATGLQNAGLLLRESLIGYTGAVPIMTGAGNQTPTRRQVELLRHWRVNFFAAGGAYLRHVANVARDELDFDVRELGLKGLLSWLGPEPADELEQLWGAPVFDNYGTNEFGTIATQCAARSGLHIFEDAFIAELLDAENKPVEAGDTGSLTVTTLFKYAAPMIRFNTNDTFHAVEGDCPCGGTHRRISGMLGRADHMIKFRGTSVFPEAVGAVVAQQSGLNGEFLCVLDREGHRERLTVRVEADTAAADLSAVSNALAERLKDSIGVSAAIDVVAPGALRSLTLIDVHTKARRLIDNTKGDPA